MPHCALLGRKTRSYEQVSTLNIEQGTSITTTDKRKVLHLYQHPHSHTTGRRCSMRVRTTTPMRSWRTRCAPAVISSSSEPIALLLSCARRVQLRKRQTDVCPRIIICTVLHAACEKWKDVRRRAFKSSFSPNVCISIYVNQVFQYEGALFRCNLPSIFFELSLCKIFHNEGLMTSNSTNDLFYMSELYEPISFKCTILMLLMLPTPMKCRTYAIISLTNLSNISNK